MSCWLRGLTALLCSRAQGAANGPKGRRICLLSRVCLGVARMGLFSGSCQAVRPQFELLSLWLWLWGLGYSDCRPGRGTDTSGLRQREACPRPLPSARPSLPGSLGESFLCQLPPTLKFWPLLWTLEPLVPQWKRFTRSTRDLSVVLCDQECRDL